MELRGITREQLAVPNMITAEQVKAWEDGNSLPTHNQAEKLAEKLGIPFLVLFLSQRPDISVNMPDLRTVSGAPVTNASPEFLQVINDALGSARSGTLKGRIGWPTRRITDGPGS